MTTAIVSSKGQVVLPKPVRDSLHIEPGATLDVWVEDARVILEPVRKHWKPLNPKRRRLTTRELCKPVALSRDHAERG